MSWVEMGVWHPIPVLALVLALSCQSLGTVGAQTSSGSTPTEASTSDLAAQRRYEQAIEMFEQRRFEEALEILRTIASRTRSPNARLAAGRCLEELGRTVEAYVEYELAVAYANLQLASGRDVYATTRSEATQRAESLRPLLGFVIVELDPSPAAAELTIGGLPFRETAIGVPVPIAPEEEIDIVVRAEGFREARLRARASPGSPPTRVSLELQSVRPPVQSYEASNRGLARLGWTASALGGVSVVAFAGTHVAADRHYDDLRSRCPGGVCDFDPADDQRRGRRLEMATNVFWIAATTFVVTSVIAWITRAVRDD